MTCNIVNQPCDLVEKGCVDETAQHLLKLWLRTKGQISDPNLFEGVAPSFVRLSGYVPENDSPEIQFVGRYSLLGRSVKAAREKRDDRRTLFDPEHRKVIRDGFELALWQPTLQLVQDSFETDQGQCQMTYERITLSWSAGTIPFIFSYSKLLDVVVLEPQSHDEPDYDHLLQPPDQGLWRQEDRPKEVPLHR